MADQWLVGLDYVFFIRFLAILKTFFPGIVCSTSILFLFVLLISVLDQIVTFYTGIVPSEFYVVLSNRDREAFLLMAAKAVAIMLAKAACLAVLYYSGSVLYIALRRCLCCALHSIYFSGNIFYKLNVLDNQIDNPDQRMTQDVDMTCSLFSQIIAQILIIPFVIIYYTYKTYSSTGYFGPLIIYSSFIIISIVNKFIMTSIIALTVEQERREGEFRFKHVSVRSNSEAIAFYHSSCLERLLVNLRLEDLLTVQSRLILRKSVLEFSSRCYDYLGAILSYLIMAIPIFIYHSYDHISPVELTRIISQNSFFYMYLINCFSKVTQLSAQFSTMAGTAHRVGALLLHMQSYQIGSNSKCTEMSEYREGHSREESCDEVCQLVTASTDEHEKGNNFDLHNLAFDLIDVCVKLPNSSKLILRDLSLKLFVDSGLLITGDSASGKTSLFRTIAGLWKQEQGLFRCHISIGKRQNLMFLPQKPYFLPGSLRQQVIYPHTALFACAVPSINKENQQIFEALAVVGLASLLKRIGGLDVQMDSNWSDILSPGEMQRLSFARVLFHHPNFVFLDEASSAVSLSAERRFYTELKQRRIGYCTIGHRESLRAFHCNQLHLQGDGTWTFDAIAFKPVTDDIANSATNSLQSITSF